MNAEEIDQNLFCATCARPAVPIRKARTQVAVHSAQISTPMLLGCYAGGLNSWIRASETNPDAEVRHEIHPAAVRPERDDPPTDLPSVWRDQVGCRPTSTNCMLVSLSFPCVITPKYSTCVNHLRSFAVSGIFSTADGAEEPL